MQFRLYLLDISGLENPNLRERAFALIDFVRKEKVYKCKNDKDRMLQIATGLLLQVGALEIEKPFEESGMLNTDLGIVFLLDVVTVIKSLKEQLTREKIPLPIEGVYELGQHGKPYWSQTFLKSLPFLKNFPFFNISHSGGYAALAIADAEIGLDIQESRSTRYIKGDYRSFSRMEAYIKCIGESVLEGYTKYEEGSLSYYGFWEFEKIPNYAVNLCYKL